METIEYKNHKINISQDELSYSPREWDNLGTMLCIHKNYVLGDKHQFDTSEIIEIYESSDNIALPLYLYDHSGITMNTSGFSCPWDSGQVGIIYVSIKKVKKEFNWKVLTAKRKLQIEQYLKNEVKTYDQFLTGDVWYYSIEDNEGESIDSCGGFFGYEYCLQEAREAIDYHIEQQRKKRQAQLKRYIINKVPIQERFQLT